MNPKTLTTYQVSLQVKNDRLGNISTLRRVVVANNTKAAVHIAREEAKDMGWTVLANLGVN